MSQIYRIKIEDNDPKIMDEDEMLEDIYNEIYELKRTVTRLGDIILNIKDDHDMINF